MSTDRVLAAIDGTLGDWGTSGDAMRWTPEPPPARVPQIAYVTVVVDAAPFIAAVNGMAQAFANALLPAFQDIGKACMTIAAKLNTPEWHALAYPERQHRRRCQVCNPWGNPPPMAGKFAPGPKAARLRRRR